MDAEVVEAIDGVISDPALFIISSEVASNGPLQIGMTAEVEGGNSDNVVMVVTDRSFVSSNSPFVPVLNGSQRLGKWMQISAG